MFFRVDQGLESNRDEKKILMKLLAMNIGRRSNSGELHCKFV